MKRIDWNLWANLENVTFLTMLYLLIHEHRCPSPYKGLHDCLQQCLAVFRVWALHLFCLIHYCFIFFFFIFINGNFYLNFFVHLYCIEHTIGICVLIVYLINLLNSLITSNSFLEFSYTKSCYLQMEINLPLHILSSHFFSFSCHIALCRQSCI